MKKAYSKPDILFESFSLATSIAAGCEVKLDTQAAYVCGIKFDNTTIFTNDVTNCRADKGGTVIADGGTADQLCYHNPYEANNVFAS